MKIIESLAAMAAPGRDQNQTGSKNPPDTEGEAFADLLEMEPPAPEVPAPDMTMDVSEVLITDPNIQLPPQPVAGDRIALTSDLTLNVAAMPATGQADQAVITTPTALDGPTLPAALAATTPLPRAPGNIPNSTDKVIQDVGVAAKTIPGELAVPSAATLSVKEGTDPKLVNAIESPQISSKEQEILDRNPAPDTRQMRLEPTVARNNTTVTPTPVAAIAPTNPAMQPIADPAMINPAGLDQPGLDSMPMTSGVDRLTVPGSATQSVTVSQVSSPQKAVVHQMVAALSKPNDGTIQIRLDPPELGRITLHISAAEIGATASVTAERSEVLDLLRKHENLLQTEMKNAGFENLAFEFSQQSDGQHQDASETKDVQLLTLNNADQDQSSAPIVPTRGSNETSLDIRL